MSSLVVRFQEIEHTQLMLVGGKALNLGGLSKIEGIQVPEGFCVTTVAYQKAIESNITYLDLLHCLTKLKIDERNQISEISKNIRQIIMEVEIPSDVVTAVTHFVSKLGDEHGFAVRSARTTGGFEKRTRVIRSIKAITG